MALGWHDTARAVADIVTPGPQFGEALACGTPVVASGVGAVPELLASDRNGFVVPPRDVTALQDALRLALATPWHRDEIAAYGQSRSWEQVATEVKACVCDLVMATSEF